MKMNELMPNEGATKTRKRVGRGPGSGLGKTAGRGHKGQKSRSGYSRRFGFEGGQMPLVRRVPKRGFKNPFAKEYVPINLSMLKVFADQEVIAIEDLIRKGLVKNIKDGVKILGYGEVERAVTVKAHKFSKSAREKIEKAGGTCEVLEL
ncbi:MAG: 50S ribosomal protein L15 [Acidobacteria bacterium CG_4_9_14_3_um_filter_49_7]|nr:MAG: 50S ribosomal protein L15 [Acidobacteria bacterium CG_4_9_14_3_um_filter_49_7]